MRSAKRKKPPGAPGGSQRFYEVKWGWTLATRSFPITDIWRSCSFRGSPAVSFPTLISIASGVLGLLAGPVAGFPGRDVSGEASSLRPCRRSLAPADSTGRSCTCEGLHKTAFYPGSASTFGGALAQGYGSDLLSFRLYSLHSQAIRFSVRLKQEVFRSLQAPATPRLDFPFAHSECESESSGEVVSPEKSQRAGSSNNRGLERPLNLSSGAKPIDPWMP